LLLVLLVLLWHRGQVVVVLLLDRKLCCGARHGVVAAAVCRCWATALRVLQTVQSAIAACTERAAVRAVGCCRVAATTCTAAFSCCAVLWGLFVFAAVLMLRRFRTASVCNRVLQRVKCTGAAWAVVLP
jgi:hypothetical protein